MNIVTKSSTSTENLIKERIQRLVKEFDLTPYTFTNDIVVEDKVIPHSHPVLTLNSFPYYDEKMHITDLIHEQLHWYFEEKQDSVNKAVEELKSKYVSVPVGHPLGCRDETSTYEHLLLCRLCHIVAVRLMGEVEARYILYYLQNHHYMWVYRTIDDDALYVDSLIEKYELAI